MLTFGSLFAGIGGFDLGFERAGLRCAWQVEIDPYCRRVLAKHWPDVRRWDDVQTFPPDPVEEWRCDVICGGFPCQDISSVGRMAGIDGKRSGLWSEFARVVRMVRPRHVVVENVSALLFRGLGRVLGDLANLGFDAEWDCLPACSLGAPHHRERVFVVGQVQHSARLRRRPTFGTVQGISADESRTRAATWAKDEPPLVGMADGIPSRVDRLRGLGNAIVPQVAEWIGRRLIAATEVTK